MDNIVKNIVENTRYSSDNIMTIKNKEIQNRVTNNRIHSNLLNWQQRLSIEPTDTNSRVSRHKGQVLFSRNHFFKHVSCIF